MKQKTFTVEYSITGIISVKAVDEYQAKSITREIILSEHENVTILDCYEREPDVEEFHK